MMKRETMNNWESAHYYKFIQLVLLKDVRTIKMP